MENEILRSQPRSGQAKARLLFYWRVLAFMTTPRLIVVMNSMPIPDPGDHSKAFKRAYESIRRLIKELREDLQPPSSSTMNYHHFYIRELGGLSLTRNEAIKYFNCVREMYDSLPNKKYYDLKSVTSLINEAILKSLDLLDHQRTTPFKKRLNSALEELASALLIVVHHFFCKFAAQRNRFKGKVR